MFLMHCPTCDRDWLVGTRSMLSFTNGADGPTARTRCPAGHVHEVVFRPRSRHLGLVA